MKIKLIVAMMALTTIVAHGQILNKGTKELDFEGSFDHKSGAGSMVWGALGFGYFVVDNLNMIVAGYFHYDDYQIGYHPAVGLQYHFDMGIKLVPFIGGNLGWGIWDYKDDDSSDKNGFVYGVGGGVKYFITDGLAVSLSVDFDWATDDLWMEKDGNMSDNNWGVRWGLRYFFQ